MKHRGAHRAIPSLRRPECSTSISEDTSARDRRRARSNHSLRPAAPPCKIGALLSATRAPTNFHLVAARHKVDTPRHYDDDDDDVSVGEARKSVFACALLSRKWPRGVRPRSDVRTNEYSSAMRSVKYLLAVNSRRTLFSCVIPECYYLAIGTEISFHTSICRWK